MKKIFIYFMAFCTLLVTSCDDSLEVMVPHDFGVTIERVSYSVGEEVVFNFSGNPGIITFYSGEIGNDYEYREGRIVPPGDISLTFENRVIYGDQEDQFSVLASTNFSGSRNIDEIKEATWHNITDRFTLASTDVYASAGIADLSDLVVDGEPLYLAFRYIFDPTKGVPRTWNVRNLALESVTSMGSTTLATHTTGGFGLFYVGPKETVGRSSIASGSITLRSNAAGNTNDYTEDWSVSTGFNLGTQDLGPDLPLKVKGNSDAPTQSFVYTYSEPGIYKAYFVASNATIKEKETVIKEINIEITP